MKSKQEFQKLLRLNRLVDPMFLTEDRTKILEEQDLTQEYSKLFFVPERWVIKNSRFVGEIYDEKCDSDCYNSNESGYLKSHNFAGEYIFGKGRKNASYSSRKKEYPEITLEQFKRLYNEARS